MNSESTDGRSRISRALIFAAVAAAFVVALFLLWHVSGMLLVIFAGIMLAIFLDGVAELAKRHLRLPRPVALPVTILLLLVLAVTTGWIAGPRIGEQFANLTDKIPAALEDISDMLSGSEWGQRLLPENPTGGDLLPLGSDLLNRVTGIFSSALGILTSALIIFFLGVYLASSPDQYTRNFVRLFPKERRDRVEETLSAVGRALRWWLLGRIASMIVIGILVTVGLLIVGIPLATTLGLIAAVLSFVPFIGPVLAAIPMILVALSEDPILVVWALLVYLVIQLLESYVITPMIQKQAVFLPPALLITVQILMSVLFGVMGMLLATPLALVAIVVIQMLYIEDVLKDKVRIMGQH